MALAGAKAILLTKRRTKNVQTFNLHIVLEKGLREVGTVQ